MAGQGLERLVWESGGPEAGWNDAEDVHDEI
jgi:hypothetical protein